MRNPSRAAAPTRAVNRSFRVSASRTPAWLHGAAALSFLIAIAGCSAPPGALGDDEGVDVPEYLGPQPNGTGTTQPPGSTTPNATGAGGTGGTTSAVSPTNNANEQTGSSNTPLTPSGNAGSGNTGTANNSGNTSNPNQGAGGSSMVPPPSGNQGAGGASMVGNDDGNTDPETPPVEPPPTDDDAPVTPDIACPAGATFCSGFESGTLPNGATYQANPVEQIQFDTSVRRSGNQSLVVRASSGGFNVREVIAPIPGQQFWVRLFVQTSSVFGDGDHDSLFVASTATPVEDNNQEHGPELAEQAQQVLLNADDNPLAGANGPGFPQSPGPQLSANTWHCLEAFYDGGNGDVQIFSDGDVLIDAPAFKPVTFQTFRFGYIQFNTPRTIWFDDVVVAPNRVGCN